ncbi:MAG: hypothetical protein J7K95_01075 [Thermoplasmata archaeon]|nr:hypothetical protein [Thermoplasmata archaeon]
MYGGSCLKAIFSTVGWHFDEPLKILASKKMEKGSKLIGIQHGGGYGIRLKHPPEEHELAICDVFYSWGWKNPGSSKIKSLPNPVVSSFKRPKKERRIILYVSAAFRRYLYRIMSAPVGSYFVEYLRWREKFFSFLNNYCLNQILVRFHPQDYGWDQKERPIRKFPKINLDNYKKSFIERIRESKLIICDNPQTTWLQLLASNTPCIFFWNPEIWEIRNNCSYYLDKLREVGILFYNPQKAADKVQKVTMIRKIGGGRKNSRSTLMLYEKNLCKLEIIG